MARQKPKKNPSQYGKGQPVDEKIVLEGMKSVQNEQVSEAEQSQGSFAEQIAGNFERS